MKLTIWQQFSSNHSASFTVVGEFESSEKANAAAVELSDILQQIREGTYDSPDAADEGEILTTTELELKDKYQVEWPASINWYRWIYWEQEKEPIYVYKTLVIVENPHWYIHTGPQPFNELVERLGGKVFLDVDVSQTYPQTALLVDFHFKLPIDTTQAEKLIAIIESDFNAHKLYYDMTYQNKISVGLETHHLDWDYLGTPRLLELERDKDYVWLFGLNFGSGDGWIEDFVNFEIYLQNSGCTEIKYSFHSERLNWFTH